MPDVPVPTLSALSTTELTVGAPLEFVGDSFLRGLEGHAEVHFRGVFRSADGGEHEMDTQMRPHWIDSGRLLWATRPLSRFPSARAISSAR